MLVGGSFGAGNYGMAGRAYSPRFLWTWPNRRISVMGGEQAAGVLATVKREGIERAAGPGRRRRRPSSRRPTLEMFERQSHPLYAAARLWDDGIIDPRKTRAGAGAVAVGGAERADPGDALRRVPDVRRDMERVWIAYGNRMAVAAHGGGAVGATATRSLTVPRERGRAGAGCGREGSQVRSGRAAHSAQGMSRAGKATVSGSRARSARKAASTAGARASASGRSHQRAVASAPSRSEG